MNSIFYLVWRNCYLRGYIRNKVCQDIVININSLIELQNNHQYLSLFTEQDKLDNNIYISLRLHNSTELDQFVRSEYSSNYNYIVNDLILYYIINELDLNQNVVVKRLSCHFDKKSNTTGDVGGDCVRLPQSLTEFIVKPWEYDDFSNTTLDSVLSNLPTSLRKLTLPSNYNISEETPTIELPSTLEDLHYESWSLGNLKKFIIASNRVFTNCETYVKSLEDLQWIQRTPWIGKLTIDHHITNIVGPGMIPPHIKDLSFFLSGTVDNSIFPKNLVKLEYRSAIAIKRLMVSQLHQLTYLDINNFNQQLEKGMLPSTLETLVMERYNSPLLPDVLPESLTGLKLRNFNQELAPFVLPFRLKNLDLMRFTGTFVTNALPCLLASIVLDSFNETFEHAPQMNHLSFLNMKILHQSVAPMISNTKRIKIVIDGSIDQDFNIQQSSIQHLDLMFTKKRSLLTPNLIPNQIKTLKLKNFDILSKGIIPNSCVKLTADIEDLNIDSIPQSTKFISLKGWI